MLIAYKTEIHPTPEQVTKVNQTIGTCRWLYNEYLAYNKKVYEAEKRFVSANEFDKYVRHTLIPSKPELSWIVGSSSKARKQAITQAETAFKNFFKGKSKFPKFKKRGKNDPKMYFVKTDAKTVIHCERHRIKIPTLGWVRLKEYGYLPINADIRSGTVSKHAGRYFVSVLVDMPDQIQECTGDPIGVDLGVKEFAIASNGNVYPNINKTKQVKKLEKKLKREQRKLSRKYYKKGKATRNYLKQLEKVQKVYYRLDCIRSDYRNKVIADLVRTKPSYIAIEDLNVSGMMKNRHLSKAIMQQGFFTFTNCLIQKCGMLGIEVRKIDRWYPSSKTCHQCGTIKKDLKLSDRTFKCECGSVIDRDLNASLNIRDCDVYKVAS